MTVCSEVALITEDLNQIYHIIGPKIPTGRKISMVKPEIEDAGKVFLSVKKFEFSYGVATYLDNTEYMGTWNCKAETGLESF